jgi:hypothetical protein
MSGEKAVRASDGKFLPGVSGNPRGRPPSKKNQITNLKQDLEIAIRQNVNPRDIQEIVQSMVDLAKEGSVGAAKLILDKTVSNAREVEDTKADSGGIRVVIENVTVGRETETIEAEDGDYEEI